MEHGHALKILVKLKLKMQQDTDTDAKQDSLFTSLGTQSDRLVREYRCTRLVTRDLLESLP
jgi:hypothetical protein